MSYRQDVSKGYNINKFKNIEKVKIYDDKKLTRSISELILKTLNKRIKHWVCPSFTKECLDRISSELNKKVSEYISWKKGIKMNY